MSNKPFRKPTKKFARPVKLKKSEIAFLNGIKPWETKMWSGNFGSVDQRSNRRLITAKFKTKLTSIQGNFCAFCGINLSLARKIHREHIAPQYAHPHYIFEPENIVLTCYDCNDHKGKKHTVLLDTNTYSTTTFNILHPFRDDFCDHLVCNFTNDELIFTITPGADQIKAQTTIDTLGLDDPTLIEERGMRIMYYKRKISKAKEAVVKKVTSVSRTRK